MTVAWGTRVAISAVIFPFPQPMSRMRCVQSESIWPLRKEGSLFPSNRNRVAQYDARCEPLNDLLFWGMELLFRHRHNRDDREIDQSSRDLEWIEPSRMTTDASDILLRSLAGLGIFFYGIKMITRNLGAMAGDQLDPGGLYFGTTAGSIYASDDLGESWREIASDLPRIMIVEAYAS